MTVKKIGNLEKALYLECVKDVPDFGIISKLFGLGADINAVNEYGETVAALVFEGYCSLHGENLRSGYYVPALIKSFVEHGFDVRRNGLCAISELQNSSYDRYVREGIVYLLRLRADLAKKDAGKAAGQIRGAFSRLTKKRPSVQAG